MFTRILDHLSNQIEDKNTLVNNILQYQHGYILKRKEDINKLQEAYISNHDFICNKKHTNLEETIRCFRHGLSEMASVTVFDNIFIENITTGFVKTQKKVIEEYFKKMQEIELLHEKICPWRNRGKFIFNHHENENENTFYKI